MKNKIDWQFVFYKVGGVLFKILFFVLILVFVMFIFLVVGVIR